MVTEEELQGKMFQFQQLSQQIQMLGSQKYQLDLQLTEIAGGIDLNRHRRHIGADPDLGEELRDLRNIKRK